MDKAKETKIKKVISKYKKIFENIPDKQKPFAEKLYSRAAFMDVTLDDLQERVNTDGPVIKTINGNGFETTLEHPAQKSYNTMIKNYNSTIKALIDLLPEDEDGDELTRFLSRDLK